MGGPEFGVDYKAAVEVAKSLGAFGLLLYFLWCFAANYLKQVSKIADSVQDLVKAINKLIIEVKIVRELVSKCGGPHERARTDLYWEPTDGNHEDSEASNPDVPA